LFAISRNTSFPVSAQECAASASSDADPVNNAATDFAAAISRFAPNATHTVSVLWVSAADDTGTIASGAPPGRLTADSPAGRSPDTMTTHQVRTHRNP